MLYYKDQQQRSKEQKPQVWDSTVGSSIEEKGSHVRIITTPPKPSLDVNLRIHYVGVPCTVRE